MEETCVRSTNQVKILGIARGYRLPEMAGRVRNLAGTDHRLDTEEKKVLEMMVRDLDSLTQTQSNIRLQVAVALVFFVNVLPTLFGPIIFRNL